MTTETNDTIETFPEDNATGSKVARRGAFAVAAGGLAAAAAAFAASGGGSQGAAVRSGGAPARPTPRPAPRPSRRAQDGDLAIAAVAASLEQLAVNTYGAALDAAGSGALGEVPPAVAEFVTVARDQHQAALDAWNGVLTGAGQPAVAAAPADLEGTVNEQFGMVTDVVGAAQLALMLEQIAAATYLDAISKLQSADAITLAGRIFPIERQHIAVLLFVLGMYPVPEVFASVDMAYTGTGAGAPMMPATR